MPRHTSAIRPRADRVQDDRVRRFEERDRRRARLARKQNVKPVKP